MWSLVSVCTGECYCVDVCGVAESVETYVRSTVIETCVSDTDSLPVLASDSVCGNCVTGECVPDVDFVAAVESGRVHSCGTWSVGTVVMAKYPLGYGLASEDMYHDDVADLCLSEATWDEDSALPV